LITTKKKIERLERQITRGDRDSDTFNNLGTAYAILGEFEKARYCYEIAIDVKPDYALAHYNLGNLYYKGFGDREKAAEQFEIFLALAPEDPRSARAREILEGIDK
jgi:tetratricopeptide (TPR) repeat protein